MKIVSDFFNKTAQAIDKKYFPSVKYYRDDKDCTDVHYTIELFNNGCLTYNDLIKRLAKSCKETHQNIHSIVSKYIEDFEGVTYTKNSCIYSLDKNKDK